MKHTFLRIEVVALAVALAVSSLAGGQTARVKESAHTNGLTPDDVMRLAKAGVSEDIIIQQIKKTGRAFDLSTDQLIAFKTANVSDRIVHAMLDPESARAAARGAAAGIVQDGSSCARGAETCFI